MEGSARCLCVCGGGGGCGGVGLVIIVIIPTTLFLRVFQQFYASLLTEFGILTDASRSTLLGAQFHGQV